MVRNAPFANRIVQFSPTLSPVTLAASETAIDRALEWGRRSVAPALPMIKRLMEPVWWEGDGPPVVEHQSTPPAKAGARPMSAIIAAARSAAGRVTHRRRLSQATQAAKHVRDQAAEQISRNTSATSCVQDDDPALQAAPSPRRLAVI
jgi:hypothetical protein